LGRRRVQVTEYSERLNTPVQATGADGFKAALALLWERRSNVPSAFPVLAVHDEIVVECDEHDSDAVMFWLYQCMKQGMASVLGEEPRIDIRVGKTWAG
ncbi:MAG: bifunctional 3'-5' exonuclease/DNA polymerase, partial [Gemmataceae bacterium]|nr:bifunctional 3'-5' exonuclease/DNA polymerase [Gemmataceae bacterium]